jgi:hypothetical protein
MFLPRTCWGLPEEVHWLENKIYTERPCLATLSMNIC